MNDAFLLYMIENEGCTEIVTTRFARINWAINQVLRGSSLTIIELLQQQGITELSDSEENYLISRLLED